MDLDIFLEALEDKGEGDVLYHVTFTDKVDDIKKNGLLPMQTSNWKQAGSGERYGGGDIFVFDNKWDAVRWAGNMDWSFHTAMGSGKISIVELNDFDDWKEDEADPLSQASNEGKWWKRTRRVKPENIVNAYPVDIKLIKKLTARN